MGAIRIASGQWQGLSGARGRAIALYAFLLGFNALAWVLLILAATRYRQLFALGILAYTFGMRHAVDADHIAAIDNTTRKLVQDGKKPVAVGFFFSLGHSTVVVGLSVLLAFSATFVRDHIPALKNMGSVIGTSVSCLFLLIIGIVNLIALIEIYKIWRQVARGGSYDQRILDDFLHNRGLMARLLKPLLRTVSNSWNMYVVGLLFGLGFDTASQVALYGLSASSLGKGLPAAALLLLPALFTAGMALLDTTDGIVMMGAYGWAFVKPVRKLYYNMNVTLLSVLVALGIGAVEGLQVLSSQLGWTGGFWDFVNDDQKLNFETLGYYIVGIFLACWIISTLFYKVKGYDRLPDTTSGLREA